MVKLVCAVPANLIKAMLIFPPSGVPCLSANGSTVFWIYCCKPAFNKFIEDYDKAKWWAKTLARRERKSKASVISLVATIQRNKILDLDAEKERKDFYQFVLDFIAANPVIEGLDFTYTSSPSDENIDMNEAKLRCFMLDLIQKINNYDACKYTFVDDKLTYSLPNVNSSLIRNNGVQLCIYNQSVIDFSTLQIFR